MAGIIPNPKFKAFIAGTGNPLVGGQLYTLIPGGSISQTKTSYTDATSNTANPNPIILDANGECNLWGDGTYKLVLNDANGSQMYSIDNVTIVGGSSSGNTTTQWVDTTLSPVYISSSQFNVAGDQRAILQSGMRLKANETAGTVYFTVSNVSYATGFTTLTVIGDTSPVDSGISSLSYGIISSNSSSLPIIPTIIKTSNYTFTVNDSGKIIQAGATSNISVSITAASPAVVTASNHGLAINDVIYFATTGVLPTGINVSIPGTSSIPYYIISSGFGTNSFQISTSLAGSAVNTVPVTCTISIATPCVITCASHGLNPGDPVQFATTGALPTGLAILTNYYVLPVGYTANAFRVGATSGGAEINTTGSQSGVQAVSRVSSGAHKISKAIALSLPAYTTLPNGWWAKVKNAGGAPCPISGTVDGVVNPVLSIGDEATIFNDGTAYRGRVISAITPQPTRFTSMPCTVPASGGVVVIAHGLGVTPNYARSVLKCLTPELGYSVGDEVDVTNGGFYNWMLYSTNVDAANITWISASTPSMPNKGTGAFSAYNLTPANWCLILRASL